MSSDALQIYEGEEVELHFNQRNLKSNVLRPLKHSLAKSLGNRENNMDVLAMVDSDGILDPPELTPLTGPSGNFITEFERMRNFLTLFDNRDDEDIIKLLTILCNLDMINVSLIIRKIIVKKFPGCLRQKSRANSSEPTSTSRSGPHRRHHDQSDGPPRNTDNGQTTVDSTKDDSIVKWIFKIALYILTIETSGSTKSSQIAELYTKYRISFILMSIFIISFVLFILYMLYLMFKT